MELAHTLVRCVLENLCGWVGVVFEFCRLKNNWSFHMEFGVWGLMTVEKGSLFLLGFAPE
jgi:hypothetical protein